jgi:heat shock protein HslJ
MKFSDLGIGWSRAAAAGFFFSSVLVAAVTPLRAAETQFPFNRELLLDAKPMRGWKQVPSLEIAANGAVSIDLWCNSVQGQIVVVEDTISVLTGPKTDRSCPPEQARGDEQMLSLLTQVTAWRREGDALILIGPQTLRFRPPTN